MSRPRLPAIDPVRLLRNVFPRKDRLRLIIVMDAYGDRSYASGLQYYAVAALMARGNDWTKLQLRWNRILHDADPSLEFFHMVDFVAAQKRPYRDWSAEKRARVLRALVSTINDTVEFACAGVMVPSGYAAMKRIDAERVVTGKPALGKNAYGFCADTVLGLARLRLEMIGVDRRVAYFYESGDEGLPEFRDSLNRILESEEYRAEFKVLSATTVSKRDAPALQTADILAYELSHFDPTANVISETLASMAQSFWLEGIYLTDEVMEQLAAEWTPEASAEIAKQFGIRIRKQRKRGRKEKGRAGE